MQQQDFLIDRLFEVLPEVPDLAPLREVLLGESRPDPTRIWSSSSAYATYDKRVLPAERVRAALERARESERQRVDRVYEAVGRVLGAAVAGEDGTVIAELVQLGEAAEAAERWDDAIIYLELAERLAAAHADRAQAALALRRLARAQLHVGEVEKAFQSYQRSGEQAAVAGDGAGAVIGRIGSGNVRSFQGRWTDAELHYREAYAACPPEERRLRAQVCLNLSQIVRERGLLDEAQRWLDEVVPVLDESASAADRAVLWNNVGLLCLARDQWDQAETAFRHALDVAPGHFARAMILDNVAELALRQGRLPEAASAARAAEEAALAAGSPRALAEVYTRLGRLARLRGEPDGVTFFEKALELCRRRPYPLLEARALLEYGLFRIALGDADEAAVYLDRSKQLFADIGAGEEFLRATAP
jgi:tetratricopeptide (TPR) repeat protein